MNASEPFMNQMNVDTYMQIGDMHRPYIGI